MSTNQNHSNNKRTNRILKVLAAIAVILLLAITLHSCSNGNKNEVPPQAPGTSQEEEKKDPVRLDVSCRQVKDMGYIFFDPTIEEESIEIIYSDFSTTFESGTLKCFIEQEGIIVFRMTDEYKMFVDDLYYETLTFRFAPEKAEDESSESEGEDKAPENPPYVPPTTPSTDDGDKGNGGGSSTTKPKDEDDATKFTVLKLETTGIEDGKVIVKLDKDISKSKISCSYKNWTYSNKTIKVDVGNRTSGSFELSFDGNYKLYLNGQYVSKVIIDFQIAQEETPKVEEYSNLIDLGVKDGYYVLKQTGTLKLVAADVASTLPVIFDGNYIKVELPKDTATGTFWLHLPYDEDIKYNGNELPIVNGTGKFKQLEISYKQSVQQVEEDKLNLTTGTITDGKYIFKIKESATKDNFDCTYPFEVVDGYLKVDLSGKTSGIFAVDVKGFDVVYLDGKKVENTFTVEFTNNSNSGDTDNGGTTPSTPGTTDAIRVDVSNAGFVGTEYWVGISTNAVLTKSDITANYPFRFEDGIIILDVGNSTENIRLKFAGNKFAFYDADTSAAMTTTGGELVIPIGSNNNSQQPTTPSVPDDKPQQPETPVTPAPAGTVITINTGFLSGPEYLFGIATNVQITKDMFNCSHDFYIDEANYIHIIGVEAGQTITIEVNGDYEFKYNNSNCKSFSVTA